MRWSRSFIQTLREAPSDAEAASHKLMVRAGLVRQLSAGVYSFLPLGLRVLEKIKKIVREEMDRAGAVELLLPAMHPAELWNETGRLAAYGAAAKSTTLLSAVGIDCDVIDFVVDRNPLKQGQYLPGSSVPIHAPEHLLTEMPDDVLLLTWNFADEILEQQAEYRRRGGRFILPIPVPRVV